MKIKILIVDDAVPREKGYHSIEEWFPGTFDITVASEATVKEAMGGDYPIDMYVRAILRKECFELALMDDSLGHNAGSMSSGREIVQESVPPSTKVIGVSTYWTPPMIQDNVIGVCADAHGLHRELANFLASR